MPPWRFHCCGKRLNFFATAPRSSRSVFTPAGWAPGVVVVVVVLLLLLLVVVGAGVWMKMVEILHGVAAVLTRPWSNLSKWIRPMFMPQFGLLPSSLLSSSVQSCRVSSSPASSLWVKNPVNHVTEGWALMGNRVGFHYITLWELISGVWPVNCGCMWQLEQQVRSLTHSLTNIPWKSHYSKHVQQQVDSLGQSPFSLKNIHEQEKKFSNY